MSDYTTTKNLGLFKPAYDADEEQWGYHLNSNADTLDGVLASDGTGQFLPLAGGTMQGTLTLFSDPASALQPVTLQYYNAHLPAAPDLSGYAPLASPAFTGDPRAPTPAPGDNDTSIATTAFVAAALGGVPGGAVIADTAPTALPGALWWDSVGCQLYVRYDDGNSVQWVNATNASLGTIQVSDSAPSNAAQNSLWFCSTDLMLYVRYYDGNSTQWVPALNLPASVGEAPVDTSVYGRSGQAWTKVAPLTAGNVGRNVLHNSMFNIAQRGTGPWTANGYTLDRWMVVAVNDTISFSQAALSDADRAAIGDEAATYALQNVFAGSGTAGSLNAVTHRIEDVRRFGGKTATLSLWAKAAAGTPSLIVSAGQNFGSGGSTSVGTANQITAISTTWARYSWTFALPSVSGKTIGTGSFTVLNVYYSLQGVVAPQSGTIQLWGVQLEVAQPGQTQPTALEKLDIGEQLRQCQRFFYATSHNAVASGYHPTAASLGIFATILFPVPMRAAPTANATSSVINANAITVTQITTSGYAFTATNTNPGSFQIQTTGTSTFSADL
jgi:hypothetical protein